MRMLRRVPLLQRLFTHRTAPAPRRPRFQPGVELLEDRTLLSAAAVVNEVRVVGDTSAIDEGERLVEIIAAGPSLAVQFSQPMDQASVEDTANWALEGSCSAIASISYDAARSTATLSLSESLGEGFYGLTAAGT